MTQAHASRYLKFSYNSLVAAGVGGRALVAAGVGVLVGAKVDTSHQDLKKNSKHRSRATMIGLHWSLLTLLCDCFGYRCRL